MLALSDSAWASLASIFASVGALIAVLIGNRRGAVIESKVETGVEKVDAIHDSVTTPNGDGRTLGQIVAEAHPDPPAPDTVKP